MIKYLKAFRSARRRKREFKSEFVQFQALCRETSARFELRWKDRYPCQDDRTGTTRYDPHYLFHLAWAMRTVRDIRPLEHVDISSHLYFSVLLSAFVKVKFYDFRPADISLEGFRAGKADLLQLPFPDKSIHSLSCMHVVEHVGLGRYGDPLDYDGDLKAMGELRRVLAPKGSLLFVVPIGRPKICFNAHRIYGYRQVVDGFAGLRLREFALIPDTAPQTGFIRQATKELADIQNYGCGCFWFERPS